MTFALGLLNTIADFTITFLPIPIIISLKLPGRLRLTILSILSVGLLASVAGVVRTALTWRLTENLADSAWDFYPLWVVTIVEINITLVSIPENP
jgi:hypothetical protein